MSKLTVIKPTGKVFANIYHDFGGARGSVHSTRKIADQQARNDRLACIEVEYTEGEGLKDGDV